MIKIDQLAFEKARKKLEEEYHNNQDITSEKFNNQYDAILKCLSDLTPGSKWKHHSGKVYEIICVANKNATKITFPVTVVYKDEEENIWSRPLYEFMKKLEEASMYK